MIKLVPVDLPPVEFQPLASGLQRAIVLADIESLGPGHVLIAKEHVRAEAREHWQGAQLDRHGYTGREALLEVESRINGGGLLPDTVLVLQVRVVLRHPSPFGRRSIVQTMQIERQGEIDPPADA